MNHDQRAVDQARAIREQMERRPEPTKESPRDARLRKQIEQSKSKNPMTRG